MKVIFVLFAADVSDLHSGPTCRYNSERQFADGENSSSESNKILAQRRATPQHLGRKTQIWDILLQDKKTMKPTARITLTLAVIDKPCLK